MKLRVAFSNIAKSALKLTSKYLPGTINTTIYYVFSDEFQSYMFRQPRGHLRGTDTHKNNITAPT